MENFADQCLDMAQSILGHNLESITDSGTIIPIKGENSRTDEAGHAALAIGEYYRATNEGKLRDYDLFELSARTISAQVSTPEASENGLAYCALGLLSFNPAKDRNPVWERLKNPTREHLDKQLLERSDYENHYQAFNIAKAVTRFTLGLSKKDETGRLIDRFLERIQTHSSNGYIDDAAGESSRLGGSFDIYGILSFIFIRQALQLHSNDNLRERKLPSLRTYSEKYLKLIPDLTRQDGVAWAYGRSLGAYGQIYCISLILQALRDGWISFDQRDLFIDTVRRLFMNFFTTYLDQDHGYLVIRDQERSAAPYHTTRMANFDAARYLCQWSRLARSTDGNASPSKTVPKRRVARFVSFDKTHRKEQGVFLYQDADSGLALQLPLIASSNLGKNTSDYLAFPHAPGIFDWPANKYLPVMQPELTFGNKVIVPSFYGKNCITTIGLRNALNFRYDQPELITKDEEIINGLGSCKVVWTFLKSKIGCEYSFSVKQQVTLDKLRYIIGTASPHSSYRMSTAICLGKKGHHTEITNNDFQASWKEREVVADNSDYRTYYGNMKYLQILERNRPLVMRPGTQYRIGFSFEPDITFAD